MILLGVSAVGGGFFWFMRGMTRFLPTVEQLQSIEPSLLSEVIAADGSVIHEFSVERRFWVPLEKIPQDLIDAVMATEDRRFFDHWGIDIKRIVGAIIVDLTRGHYAQGASTITQQLARNLYLTSRQSMVRKIREALTAMQLESYYTKAEILEFYLNQVYLGAGVYGVQAASQRYFRKDVSELTLNECAVLAGVIQLPEHYRPDKEENRPRTTKRRNAVLSGMRKMRMIDKETARTVAADTIPCNPPERGSKIAPYFIEMVRQEVAGRYGAKALYNGGLTIYTTLDPHAQDSTEKAAAEHLKSLQKGCNRMFADSTRAYVDLGMSRGEFLSSFDSLYEAHREEYEALPDSHRLRIAQVSVVGMDVKTGALRVMIGGRDFSESKFNRAVQARRQPGSSFKPFVYTAAIENGYAPFSVVLDQPITLQTPEGEWRPENYDRKFLGPITIRRALAKSVNLVAIQVLTDVGADVVISYARKMGLQRRLNPVPALAIGACEVTPVEMARAYGIFPNYGVKVEPYCVEKVVSKDGRVLYEHSVEQEEALPPETAFIMADMLTGVVQYGTGASIPGRGFTRPAGGKTGTTNDYSDAWFVGFTPQIVCAVWVGVDERRSLGAGVTGSRGAIPIWVGSMIAMHRDLPRKSFGKPSGVKVVQVCDKTNEIATRYCPKPGADYLIEGTRVDTCSVHGPRRTRRTDNIHRLFGSQKRRRQPAEEKEKRRPLMF